SLTTCELESRLFALLEMSFLDNEERMMEVPTGSIPSSPRSSPIGLYNLPPTCHIYSIDQCSITHTGYQRHSTVTDAMIREEESLKADNARESEDEKRKVDELSCMKVSKRFERLQHLLNKSNIYSKILLSKMEAQIEENKKEKERKRKSEAASTEHKTKREKEDNVKTKARRSTRKRKVNDETDYQLSDYMDESGRLKKRQKVDVKPNDFATSSSQEEGTCRYIEGQLVPSLQPKLVTGGILRPYQLEGVEWLNVLYENGVNGILADEMGLGKTIQCIAFIAHLIEMGVLGPFIVVAPLSTISNWVSEFKKFAPTVSVFLYHGSISDRLALRKKIFKSKHKDGILPVVVTSYEIVLKDSSYLANKSWKFLIVDEGHRIKNLNCKLIRTLKTYDAANRLLLTGTPLQNNLTELWSLLNFLLPDLFDDLNSFQSWFDFSSVVDDNTIESNESIINREKEEKVLSTLHQILTPFLLRRLKTDVELGIPPKREVLVYAPLTSLQEKYYTLILNKTIDKLIKNGEKSDYLTDDVVLHDNSERSSKKKAKERLSLLSDDQIEAHFEALLAGQDQDITDIDSSNKENENCSSEEHKSVFNVKMTCMWVMLRKCCNHPYLVEFPLTDDGQPKIDGDLITASGKLLMLHKMLPHLVKQQHKVLIFSQMTQLLDILSDYLELSSLGYSRLDGTMSYFDRELEMARFRDDPDCNVFLLSTRAGGLGINLTSADTVIIFDSDWNPQVDLQAQDRCHRIGQTKPVMVYRFVTANTIDQKIVERAAGKRRLEKMIIHKGKFKGGKDGQSSAFTVEELVELLESVDHDKVVSSNDIISDTALAALLDRSMLTGSSGKSGTATVGPDHDSIFKVIIEDKDDKDMSLSK
uniref:Proliferation-associated SNF2-like protein n=1 Tax=Amphimedon queenslandica TaxID=400682 RepID=A0A1X7TQS9_AMPQE